jgi:sialate O-acetylesterase
MARRLLAMILLCGSLSVEAQAELWLPSIFGDHMVLQRQQPIPLWGTATPGSPVSAHLGEVAAARTVAGDDGRWHLSLPAQPAGGPHSLAIEGDGRVVFRDVLVGEVWLASGQSNMQWLVSAASGAEAEIAAADHPLLRLFLVPLRAALEPQTDVEAAWTRCTPETVPTFSAVAYYFARRLQRELDVPVGIIASSWGGTRIEPWTTPVALDEVLPRLPEAQRQSLEAARERARTTQAETRDLFAVRQASVAALRAAEADSVGPPQSRPELDDSDWPTMPVPGQWESGGLPGFDGMVWLRRDIDIPAGWAGRDLTLRLCPADEIDITWFDGARVGASGSYTDGWQDLWDDPRSYRIPGRLVQAGRRVLSVRVIDGGYAGGLWGSEADSVYLAPADEPAERLPLAGDWRYQAGPRLAPAPPAMQQMPSGLYHSMIHPLVPFALRGAIWYQGEANRADGAAYADKMAALIGGWREAWGQPLDFCFAQLAPYRYGGDAQMLPRLWEAQADVVDRVSGTGMAVLTDVGDVDDIHPRDKRTVGRRLAGWALARTYGKPVAYAGPRYVGSEIDDARLRLRFERAQGLHSADGGSLTWFEVAGADGQFHPATAVIEGSTVVLSHPQVPHPERARFAWHEEAEPNLVNGAGLPAAPFRTHR